MTDELKPVKCGCGGDTRIIHGDYYGEDRNSVYCTVCGIQTCYYATDAEAITAWNRAMGADKVDELMEHVWREKLDTREKIAELVERMLR